MWRKIIIYRRILIRLHTIFTFLEAKIEQHLSLIYSDILMIFLIYSVYLLLSSKI